ncbi:unnamed protein product [Candidula unifasciata]|uniref:Protein kinase domain-containing protein n=1 Tax=Candidula unifasciata TaxID=100452 RepID=A0A8S3Z5D6_9EUPU|nr:unnamed protein product [Candidula unifasciata]
MNGLCTMYMPKAFLDILQQLYELHIIDINKAYSGKTGLQIACENGYVDIVKWLLEHGAEMKNAYDENSEFYLATLNGNQDVLAVLLKQKAGMVADKDIQYCLLYAACKGGHLELVKRWFSPDMDVTEKTFYISDLSKCEQMYPLFAACEGNHFEVATFLIQEGEAAITRDICYYFPEFSARLVRSLFLKSDTNGQQFFHLSKRKIEYLLPCWFCEPEKQNVDADICEEAKIEVNKDEDTFDIVIDAHENRLQELPDDVLWSLINLISLNASHNPLKSIPSAFNPGSLHLNGLKILNFEHCLLESISSDVFSLPCLEQVNLSHNRLHTLSVTDDACHTAWKCTELKSLDISHNLLESVPCSIQVCARLISLNASHNQLQTICMPWQCPMESLDLSFNKLSTFPPSAYQYWGKTLKKLHLHHNLMTELAESIVRMRNLSHLDVSHNKIQQMPHPGLWCCPLFFFNLNHNMLVSCLASTLNELCIANNRLEEVPSSISDLRKLFILDISDNKIRSLPLELGKLRSLAILKVKGIKVKDTELGRLITSLDSGVKDVYASSIIQYLDRARRKCIHAGILKIIVLGCKNKDGYCIVQELANKRNVQAAEHEVRANLSSLFWYHVINVSYMLVFSAKQKKVKLKIWELPDSKVTSSILPCFLTLNSLYLIVHDVSIYGADVHSVSEKVASIQACVLRPHVIVVCIYSKLLDQDEQKRLEKDIFSKLGKILPKAMLVSVISGDCCNSRTLQQAVNSLWETMSDAAYDPNAKICQRQVPRKFLEVIENLARFKKNICRMSELLQAVNCNIKDLEDGLDQNLTLRNFLLQAGGMLHYNMHVGELSDCVILNPAWLFDLLLKFLQNVMTRNSKKAGQLPLRTVRDRLQEILPAGNYDYFPAILKLMEAFNIGVRLMDNTSKEEEIFLVPSLLPKQPPEYQVDADKDACKAARLYCLPAVPPALWSNLISQLILAFNRYSASRWSLGEQKSQASRTNSNSRSFMTSGQPSLRGLHISNKNIQYWRTMIMMYYDQGHVVVEEVECKSSSEASAPGILVTVQTTGSGKADDLCEQSPNRNEKKLSILGIVLDELEEILERFNPKFRDLYDANLSEVYAICPRCYDIKPGLGSISLSGIHFTVKDCAQMLLSVNAVVCQSGPSSLSCLVPELMFMELPSKMHLSPNDLILTDVKLGRGMTGDVRKGVYRGTDVAVKVFYNPDERPFVPNNPSIKYNNVADAATEFKAKQYEINTEQIKISNAFTDVRREVGILSKLSHEFIVTFIGLCIRPQLLLAMELAPFGSLRTQLDKKVPAGLREIQHMDKVISQSVFSKDLTYKIILQIGSGLCYLHKNSIIYRDLKPDNILVMSLSVEDRVNVKLSDYGISKFKTLTGVTGVFGTVGYMAPEMLLKRPYTEKADMYSFAVVIAEILTGISPVDCQFLPRLSYVDTTGATPGHLKDYQIKCHFPALESLMKECWSQEMDDRPSSVEVFKMIKSDQFLLLYDSLILDRKAEDNLEVTCVYACQTHGRWRIWVSESGQGNSRFISVYDVETSGSWCIESCAELNSLEVIERGNQSNFEVCCSVTLDAVATKIVNHVYEKSESFLLIGLENGCLTTIHSRSSPCKSVTASTNTELHRATPIADICSVDFYRIAVACGMAVCFLNVTLPDCQEGVKGIWIPELVNSGMVSMKHVADVYSPVVALVAEGNSVWCCLENSSCLVKINVDLMRIVLIVTVSWSSVSDAVRLEEMDKVERPPLRLFASDSAAELRISNDDKYALALASGCRVSVDDDVFSKKEPSEMVGMHCSSESDICAAKSISEELVSASESNDFTRNRSQTTNNNDKPPLPPPRRNKSALERAVSMPGLQEKPPLVPERSHSQENNISITSLCVTCDILAIGTSNGGISLLPLVYHTDSDKSGSPPSLPFQLPLLRHPTTRKEHTVKSQLQNVFARQGKQSAGSILCLTLAGKNLVSLYCPAQVSHRISSRTDGGRKRFGIIINGNQLNICNEADKDTQDFVQTPKGNAESVGCRKELPVSFQHFTSSDTDKMQLPEVADIAVWDNISWNRLQTVRSYGHELIGCNGWCCLAPSLAGSSASSS